MKTILGFCTINTLGRDMPPMPVLDMENGIAIGCYQVNPTNAAEAWYLYHVPSGKIIAGPMRSHELAMKAWELLTLSENGLWLLPIEEIVKDPDMKYRRMIDHVTIACA